MDNINVGYYLRQRRIELGLTQVQLAQKIGKALQVNVDYFFPASQKQVGNHPRSGQALAICDKKLSTAYGAIKEHY